MDKKIILIIVGIIILTGILFFVFAQDNNELEEEGEEATTNEEEQLTDKEKHMDYLITLETNKGNIEFKTYSGDAPNTVENFVTLANKGFYEGVIFHRVIDGFMIQGGDPTGTGMGGPGYSFDDEIDPNSALYQRGYRKGIVAMANSGPNTQGSQFFIMVADYPLPPSYTIFGEVAAGQEVADAISEVETDANDRPLEEVVIERVLIEEAEIRS